MKMIKPFLNQVHVLGGGPAGLAAAYFAKSKGSRGLIDILGIVECYSFLYNQPHNAQTFELDVRTSIEKW